MALGRAQPLQELREQLIQAVVVVVVTIQQAAHHVLVAQAA